MKRAIKILSAIILLAAVTVKADIFLVTNNNSSGSGSLKQAVTDANANAGADTILFAADVRGTINNNGVLSLTEELTIIGPGPGLLEITSGGTNRVIIINDVYDGVFNIIGLTISGGTCTFGPGAGIYATTSYLNIINCIIKDNTVTYPNSGGGALYFHAYYVVIENSVIMDNVNQLGGAGMVINSDGLLRNSAFINNTVTEVNPYWGGGAIYNVNGTLTIENCTFSGNVHPLAGGGIYNNLLGQLKLYNCTFVNNQSETGGGIANFSSSSEDTMITLCNSIFANNSATTGSDLYGNFRSYGYNLIESTDSATISGDETGNIYGEDPELGDLTSYSPTVYAHPPLAGSPVLESGNNASCLLYDQRGIKRPQDGNEDGIAIADIGSFETMVDSDNDGVSDIEEKGPDGNDDTYDGNGDSFPDYTQPNVTSLWNYDNSFYVTLAAPNGVMLLNVFAVEDPSKGNLPAGISFPVGFFKFMIELQGNGPGVDVMIYFPPEVSVTNYYKYGSTSDLTMPHWYLFNYDGSTGAEIIASNQVNLHFIDGDRGDDDLTVNDIIVDPGGPEGTITDVKDESSIINEYQLFQNYPNPFNPSTIISFVVGQRSFVSLKVYDVLGREIATLLNEEKLPGEYLVEFDAQQTTGSKQLSSGVYFYKIQAGDFVQVKKMVFLR